MKIEFNYKKNRYRADLSKPIDISIPISDKRSPIAFNAPELRLRPFEAEGFIGALEAGSPVNFYDILLNPHGNCTHTESALHIDKRAPDILSTLKQFHYHALLLTVAPIKKPNGDLVIDGSSSDWDSLDYEGLDAIIIRTMPNSVNKKYSNYTNTNPPYLDPDLAYFLSERIDHLLLDLPSVDKEKDGGQLLSHKAFWQTERNCAFHKTITELIYVDSSVKDGLYLLNIQTIPLAIDVSPSRPLLFPIEKI